MGTDRWKYCNEETLHRATTERKLQRALISNDLEVHIALKQNADIKFSYNYTLR